MKWISISEGMPKKFNQFGDSVDCLVCNIENYSTATAWYNYKDEGWHILHFSAPSTPIVVTHWMPLPKLPEDVIKINHHDKNNQQSRSIKNSKLAR